MLQECLCNREHGISVPFKADTEATEDDLRNHHLVLIGHPGTNALAARFRDQIPVPFGPHSFSIRGITYAHPETSILVAAENPMNRKFSLVLFAGLGTRATVDFARKLDEDNLTYAPVVVLSAGPETHPISEFVIDLPRPRDVAEIRLTPRFTELYEQIWHSMKEEVLKGYAQQKK